MHLFPRSVFADRVTAAEVAEQRTGQNQSLFVRNTQNTLHRYRISTAIVPSSPSGVVVDEGRRALEHEAHRTLGPLIESPGEHPQGHDDLS
jgi:hypothetical protein